MSDAAMPVPSQVVRWKVISQTPQIVQDQTGGYVQGVRVMAQIVATGTSFYVDIPGNLYNANGVAQALTAKAYEVMTIDGLTG